MRRGWLRGVAVVSLLGLAVHGVLTAATLGVGDRSVFGVETLDARWGYVAVALVALAALAEPRVRPWWLVLMSFTTFGRAVSLWVLGSPALDRPTEQRGCLTWILLWLLGVLAVLVIEAAGVFREANGGHPR